MENHSKTIEPGSTLSFTIDEHQEPIRIDTFLSEHFTDYSRSFFQRLIKQNLIECNNKVVTKPSHIIESGDYITVTFPEKKKRTTKKIAPKSLEIEKIFEHPHFLIINKPAGLLVHETAGQDDRFTLVDWLIQTEEDIEQVGHEERPGIIHRLDKDTSGLMIIPRTNYAHNIFGQLFRNRDIKKTYLAVVKGHPDKSGVIDFPIARDTIHRKKMTHKNEKGRAAKTYYRVLQYFDKAALVELKPITGRTHQIRVHLAAIGHPIIGDLLYGTKSKKIKRQALHAQKLEFNFENNHFSFSQEIPDDMKSLLNTLTPVNEIRE